MCRKQLWIAVLLAHFASVTTAVERPTVVVRYARETPAATVYAWERWGNFINAVPGDGKEIPYDAAKLKARVFAFPAGEIRVIEFNAPVRTHNHVNMTDTILYTWSGRRVQFVNNQAEHNRPGDAAFHPRGVFHHGEAIETGKGVEFAMFTDKVRPNPEAHWRFAKDTPLQSVAAGAARFQARIFNFPPYAASELILTKGTAIPLDVSKQQMLIVLAGTVTVSTAGQTYELGVEDTAYAKPGEAFTLRATADARVLTCTVPRDTPPPPAFR